MDENNFEQCLKCSICTVYCPMMEANPLYPGPKQAGPDGERYRLKNPEFYDEALKYCLNCKRCEVACPSDVKVGDLILAARLDYDKTRPSLRDRVMGNTDFAGKAGSSFARLANPVMGLKPVRLMMDRLIGVDRRVSMPQYASETFEKWFARHPQQESGRSVRYFHGCYVNYNNPQLGKDLVALMNALGYGVSLMDGEKCCGTPMLSNGLIGKAIHNAVANMKSLRSGEGPVLVTGSTCTLTLRDEYPNILGIDNSDVRENILLATRFIYQKIESGEVRLAFRKDYKKRIAYHTPCHMAKMGWEIYTAELLKMIPGVDFVRLEQQCCGVAGTFGFKKEYRDISTTIGSKLFALIEDAAPDFVATDCETCKMQIEMCTGYEVKHPVSILLEALDVEKTKEMNLK